MRTCEQTVLSPRTGFVWSRGVRKRSGDRRTRVGEPQDGKECWEGWVRSHTRGGEAGQSEERGEHSCKTSLHSLLLGHVLFLT